MRAPLWKSALDSLVRVVLSEPPRPYAVSPQRDDLRDPTQLDSEVSMASKKKTPTPQSVETHDATSKPDDNVKRQLDVFFEKIKAENRIVLEFAQMSTESLGRRLDERLDGLSNRFDRVEHRLDRVETRLDGVETRLGGVETRLGGVETRLGHVEQEVRAVREDMSGFAKASDLRALEHRVTALEQVHT
jgi:archaellum component FlaC